MHPDASLPWWIDRGDLHCEFCLQSCSSGMESHCTFCDAPMCSLCAVTSQEDRQGMCPVCSIQQEEN
jgi:hypothetical protein